MNTLAARPALVLVLAVAALSAGAAELTTTKPATTSTPCPAPCVEDARSRPKANIDDPRVMKPIDRNVVAPAAPAAGTEVDAKALGSKAAPRR